MEIKICPSCEGTGEISEDVGTHYSEYESRPCSKCNGDEKIYTSTIRYEFSLPFSNENRSLMYKIDSEIHDSIRQIYKKYNLKF